MKKFRILVFVLGLSSLFLMPSCYALMSGLNGGSTTTNTNGGSTTTNTNGGSTVTNGGSTGQSGSSTTSKGKH